MPLANVNSAQAAIKVIAFAGRVAAGVVASDQLGWGKDWGRRPGFVMLVGCAMRLAYRNNGLCALPTANDVEQVVESAL